MGSVYPESFEEISKGKVARVRSSIEGGEVSDEKFIRAVVDLVRDKESVIPLRDTRILIKTVHNFLINL